MRRRALGVAAGLGAVLLAAGCGTGGVAKGNPDVANGQKLFTGGAQCAACHTLSAAGTSGTIGPNLDDAFRSDREQGFDQNAIENVILDQIRLGSGPVSNGTPMPANLVRGQDALDVAAYVASVAGTGPATSGSPAQLGTNGGAIFKADCASCHTLKAAGSSGTVGPNLDQLKPKQPIVVHQVTNGGAVMPAFKGKLSPAQIQAVATYVATNAGK
ncbi:MAG TPA: c-type cytochrome [Gaiellaceae bacterium]